jgi:hypothetical protein
LNTTHTVSLWFRCTNISTEQTLMMIPRGTGSFTTYYGAGVFQPTNNTKAYYYTQNGGSTTFCFGTTTIAANTWYHYVATHDGVSTLAQVWINGRPDCTPSGHTVTTATTPARGPAIGRYNDGSFTNASFNGNIQNVQIWNRVLRPDEIVSIYTNPYCMFV